MPDATVKAIFAGDSTSLERSLANVGQSTRKMASDIETSSKETRRSFDGLAGGVDDSESKFRGFGDTIAGTGDIMTGFREGDIVGVAMGFADLAGGITDFVVPAIKSMAAKFGLMTGATAAQTTATTAAAGAQTGLNAALLANPIGLVVIAIGALVGAFVLAWKHSETFRDIVRGAFGVVKDAAGAAWDFIASLPEKIGGLGRRLIDVITWPYRTAFNMVADIWNRTLGGVGFEIPDWVPGVGGKGWSFPKMPKFHTGGVIPGVPGTQVPVMALAGETISRPGAGAPTVIQLVLDGRVITEVVHDGLLAKQRRTPLGLAS